MPHYDNQYNHDYYRPHRESYSSPMRGGYRGRSKPYQFHRTSNMIRKPPRYFKPRYGYYDDEYDQDDYYHEYWAAWLWLSLYWLLTILTY